MKLNRFFFILLATASLPSALVAADISDQSISELKSAVIANYAAILSAEYQDSFMLARRFQTNVEAFLKQPTAEHLAATKESWIACRQPYSQTEIARFYDGPIETVENYVNAWPIDPNYLDYTVGSPNAGIINDVADYPEITREVIVGVIERENDNGREGEKTISTGFHAIEFLLWGQDLYADKPGQRSYTDYLEARSGPGLHASRRSQYLNFLTQLLVDDLQAVMIQWSPGQANNYRSRLLVVPADTALTKIFTGVGNLANSELMNERLLVPFTTKSQENEQCCFSDTTHLDLIRNEMGVQDILLGRYTRADGSMIEGPGLLALIGKADPKLAAKLREQQAAALTALQAIPQPFDQAILGADSMSGRVAIKKALVALEAQNASIAKAAAVLHLQLNLK